MFQKLIIYQFKTMFGVNPLNFLSIILIVNFESIIILSRYIRIVYLNDRQNRWFHKAILKVKNRTFY